MILSRSSCNNANHGTTWRMKKGEENREGEEKGRRRVKKGGRWRKRERGVGQAERARGEEVDRGKIRGAAKVFKNWENGSVFVPHKFSSTRTSCASTKSLGGCLCALHLDTTMKGGRKKGKGKEKEGRKRRKRLETMLGMLLTCDWGLRVCQGCMQHNSNAIRNLCSLITWNNEATT